ncbi:peptidoglycan-binding domain-containing protein [Altererythrobacter arenosus]|uniref:Peptidoglycan-binding domain-containing protein n=1 Tax=Altererythrobacter arenosus TaxID=3032592 RepID=A0ABY8FMF5_9SPHN|nr:peptidoglycan-binding domain-containing protein [Altererythrobacter sp. CAU 1644]WFL75952.1 peptidoglycan-binding domain-containing protein [Altererythrobacter sp. CAU 1644]
MRIVNLIAGAILIAAWPGVAQAEDEEKQFAVEGAGRLDCATFTKARVDKGSAEFQRFIGFVEGYLSAANRYEPNTFDLSPWHNAAAFDLILEKHCNENPQEALVSVVQKMVGALRPVRVAEFSPMVEVGSGENRAFVYETILRRAQAVLRTRGLYSGAEDGKYSPQMRDALLTFQKNSDLYATGVPDPATLWTLLNP